MRRLALLLTAASALAFTAPTFATEASAGEFHAARPHVKVVKTTHRGVVKKVVVRRNHHPRHWRSRTVVIKKRPVVRSRTVIIKKRPVGTIVKKKIIHRG
jgi:hypothetical protein